MMTDFYFCMEKLTAQTVSEEVRKKIRKISVLFQFYKFIYLFICARSFLNYSVSALEPRII